MFRSNSQLELLRVAKTRFASHYVLLKRLLDCKDALKTTVVRDVWKEWVQKGDELTRLKGSIITDTICSEDFWEEVKNVISITEPIYFLIKFADGEGSKMGEFYEKMDVMLGQIKDIMESNKHAICYPTMESLIIKRWTKMNYSLHCLGFALSPRFYDQLYLATPAPGGIARKAPICDKEVVKGVMDAFKKIGEDGVEQKLLRDQFAIFHMRKGIYGRQEAQVDAATMDAIEWWSTYGSETPELAEVAKKILSQPISSSSAERAWSTYSYIHNVKRNRLNGSRADKLVFIHSNIRLLSRFSESYKKTPYKDWDMHPDDTNMEDSFTRTAKMRECSLDSEHNQQKKFSKGGSSKGRGKKT